MPTLAQYRQATLQEEGGVLGVMSGTVTLDPDVADREAARSLISAKLYDDEKLSGAFGGQYVWIPRYSDQRRTLTRGYRVRYASIFSPPTSGTYRLQFFGYGETREFPYSTNASMIENEVKQIDVDLAGVEVEPDPLGMLFHLGARIGMGATAGRMIAQGGVGICLVNRDFSVPLKKNTPYLISPRIPFETEDELTGLHECINLALNDIREADLLPVVSGLPYSQRSGVVQRYDIAPWLEADLITGFYAPTNWVSVTRFRPPTSGTYLLEPVTHQDWSPIPTPLPYNATGLDIENALKSVIGSSMLRVNPQGVAGEYDIIWETMHHQAMIVCSAGAITDYSSERLRDPYPTTISPAYMGDFESDSFTDPGYGPDQTWFVACRRPASTRICPQTYPRRADGSLDQAGLPIPGSVWIESLSGLVNDLDQARPSVEKVAPAALRYAAMALAAVAPAGEAARWEAMAGRSAMHAAARVIYGKQHKRGVSTVNAWPPMGPNAKAWAFFQPER